jgi:co-chaperonin GroES (HSP10)
MSARLKLREIAAAASADPKAAILTALGDSVIDFEVFGNRVLVATYIEPETTRGGIILPDRTLMEGRFQGKVFLVLKAGPLAFVDDAIAKFGGVSVEPGDWVVASPSDGYELWGVDQTGGVSCRLFEDALIKGRVKHPGSVY